MTSIIICTYKRAESLRTTLESLAVSGFSPGTDCELVVIDNNSPDQTAAVVDEFSRVAPLPVRYVFERQQGLSYARNRGIQEAHGDIIVFADDDITFSPGWFGKLITAFDSPDCAACGGKVVAVWPGKTPAWFQESGPYATPNAISHFDLGDQAGPTQRSPIGANMAFRRDLFEKYGGFRTDLGRIGGALGGGEDYEFFYRLFQAGETVLYVPEAVVYHPVAEYRARKSYFESWCYHGARTGIRLDGIPKSAICCFGVPRFMLRKFALSLGPWLTTFEPRRRFYYKLQVYIEAGRIAECWQSNRRSTAALPAGNV